MSPPPSLSPKMSPVLHPSNVKVSKCPVAHIAPLSLGCLCFLALYYSQETPLFLGLLSPDPVKGTWSWAGERAGAPARSSLSQLLPASVTSALGRTPGSLGSLPFLQLGDTGMLSFLPCYLYFFVYICRYILATVNEWKSEDSL